MKRLFLSAFLLPLLGCDRLLSEGANSSSVAVSARVQGGTVPVVDSVVARLTSRSRPEAVSMAAYVKGGTLVLGTVPAGDSLGVSLTGFVSSSGNRVTRWYGSGAGYADGAASSVAVPLAADSAAALAPTTPSGSLVGATLALPAGTVYTTDGSDPRTSQTVQVSSGSVTASSAGTIRAALRTPATGTTPEMWSDVSSWTFQEEPVVTTNDSLSDLKASVGTFGTVFSRKTLAYVLTLPAGVDTVRLLATAADTKATIAATLPGGGEVSWPLKVTDSVTITLTVTARDGSSKRVHAVTIKASPAQLRCDLPSGSTIKAPTYPRFYVDPGVDTAGLRVRFAIGRNPQSTDSAFALPKNLGLIGPYAVRASLWREGVQVGTVQSYDWSAQQVVTNFDDLDSTVAWNVRAGNTSALYAFSVDGFAWVTENSSLAPTRSSSSLGTTGSSLKLSMTVAGANYPSAGIGLSVPYNVPLWRGGQDFSKLDSIRIVWKDSMAEALGPQWWIALVPDSLGAEYSTVADSISYFGWYVSSTKGVVTLRTADAKRPSWNKNSNLPTLAQVLPRISSLNISLPCATSNGCTTGSSGSLEIDDVTYFFH